MALCPVKEAETERKKGGCDKLSVCGNGRDVTFVIVTMMSIQLKAALYYVCKGKKRTCVGNVKNTSTYSPAGVL